MAEGGICLRQSSCMSFWNFLSISAKGEGGVGEGFPGAFSPSVWCEEAVLIKGQVPEIVLCAEVDLKDIHVVVEEIARGGVALLVAKDCLEVMDELSVVGVLDVEAAGAEGAVYQFAWESALDTG